MKVVFITTHLSGGAGIACRRLMEGMQMEPNADELTLIYRQKANLIAMNWVRKSGNTESIILYEHPTEWPDENISRYLNEHRSYYSDTYISGLESTLPYDNQIEQACNDADLINAHWTSGLLSARSWTKLVQTGKPILVSLHDFNYITGGCHYPAGCTLYESGCTHCPQVSSEQARTVIASQYKLKKHIFNCRNIFWTAPSNWLTRKIERSGIVSIRNNILNQHRNIVDSKLTPTEIDSGREPKRCINVVTIGLVADNLTDSRKGILQGAKAAARAARLLPAEWQVSLHLIGKECGQATNAIEEGRVKGEKLYIGKNHGSLDSKQIQDALAELDILLLPSLEENYSNLLIEAISAGTTCIGFAVGGNREIAFDYPRLMNIVGDSLNIHDGINKCQPNVIGVLTEYMAAEIARLARDSIHHKSEAARCRMVHSAQSLIRVYCQTFRKIIQKTNDDRSTQRIKGKSMDWNEGFESDFEEQMLRKNINYSEPVAWIDLKSVAMSAAKHHAEGIIYICCLKPSWEIDYYHKRLSGFQGLWMEYDLVVHSNASLPQLEYWDMQLLTIRNDNQGTLSQSEIGRKEEMAIPILCAWHSVHNEGNCEMLNTVNDIRWECILNNCIVPPMMGLASYQGCRFEPSFCNYERIEALVDSKTTQDNCIIAKRGKSLSRLIADYTVINGPVLWLPRALEVDIDIQKDQWLVFMAHIPSWDPQYITNRIDDKKQWSVAGRIPHYEAHIDELQYWDTVVYQVRGISYGERIFIGDDDDSLALAISFMALCCRETRLQGSDFIKDSLLDARQTGDCRLFRAEYTLKHLLAQLEDQKDV